MADQPLWVKKEAGELLSSADWNGMQRLAQADIAKVGARVDAVEAAAGRRQGTMLVVANMVSGEGSFENGGGTWSTGASQYGPYVQITGCANQYYWDYVPSPTLRFTLATDSVVQLFARGTIYNGGHSYNLWTQFILGQGTSRAPARIQGNPNYGQSHTLTYTPDATTWSRWLTDNAAAFATNKRWPLCGQVAVYPSSTYVPFQQAEQVELPAGSYTGQLGFTTNTVSTNGYYWYLCGLSLSATIIPL